MALLAGRSLAGKARAIRADDRIGACYRTDKAKKGRIGRFNLERSQPAPVQLG